MLLALLALFGTVAAKVVLDVSQPLGNQTDFDPAAATEFEVRLQSLETDVYLMFNSSNDENAPMIDVLGSFCEGGVGEELFAQLKGPVSKMISRTDLMSLKSRTKCNESEPTEERVRVFLTTRPSLANQSTPPTETTATIRVFLLINATSTKEKSVVTSITNSLKLTTANSHRRRKRSPETANLEVDAIISGSSDEIAIKIFDGDTLGQTCSGHAQISAKDCNSSQVSLNSAETSVFLNDLLNCEQRPLSIHVSVQVQCGSEAKNLKLEVVPGQKGKGNLFFLWIPLAVLIVGLGLVIAAFAVIQHRRQQQRRHEFQRQTALSRTLSDPKPKPVRTQQQ